MPGCEGLDHPRASEKGEVVAEVALLSGSTCPCRFEGFPSIQDTSGNLA